MMSKKITHKDLYDSVLALEEFRQIGSEPPALSKPVLFKKDGVLYCVFMAYETYREEIPDFYVITPLPALDPKVYEPADAMEFLGMPDEVLFGKPSDRVFPGSRDDLMELFDGVLAGDEISAEAYNAYLDTVIECASATAVRFYEFFRM